MRRKKRELAVVKTSIISIITNIALVIMKGAIGLMSNSIAIITDAVNNTTDALSSIITIIGAKYAASPADKEHPYGHGRAEYISSLIVSAIVLYAGATALIESIKKIFNTEPVDYSTTTIVILVIGIIAKFGLGIFVRRKGEKFNSGALKASGIDAFNDGLLSISVLAAVIIFMVFGVNIESYVGILVSLYIIKTGIELIRESVNNVIGRRIDKKIITNVKKTIMNEKSVLGVYDLILNDYGPEQYSGSVHVELPDKMNVVEIDKLSRRITKTVLEKYGILIHTVGVYSINTEDPKIKEIHSCIKKIVLAHKSIIEMHGFYVDIINKTISFDIVVDFEEDRMKVYEKILDEARAMYPDYDIQIVLDDDTSAS